MGPSKRKRILNLNSSKLCIFMSIHKLAITIFMIHNCYVDEAIPGLIQQPKMFVELQLQ